ncbi:MAG: Unknown protein [uncultured Aureispira sp.]|uniref:Secretion system C-terminal sorting domain-containing protein n=1 Tax=uncultured Aureispira sp. TaxID=1331704 RepID=A0A6S6UG11_9BACT|nr:MAG: Unknown protein [uncultured Aureispira sp.]
MRLLLKRSFLLLLCYSSILQAQFAPIAGQPGSTAIHKDSSILLAWATQCTVERGFMDISQPNLGRASAGNTNSAVGAAGDGFILSLGDGGTATLRFEYPIQNGLGADFAIFENAFSATFLEVAFVEVSSDGINFVRFPAISNTDTNLQVNAFGSVDASHLYNLAGKYRANYGTPFDLAELLADSAVLNVNAVTHVRLVDAVGSLQDAYASRDSRGVKVNDPWSTPFASSGFDLDAVGVIHQNTTIGIHKIPTATCSIYPNPVQQGASVFIEFKEAYGAALLQVYNLQGQLILEQQHSEQLLTLSLPQGLYLLKIQTEQQHFIQQLIVY